MSDANNQPSPPAKRPANKAVQIGAFIGMIVGVVGFQVVGPKYFPPPPGGGINWMQVLWAGLIGGVSAGLGAIIGAFVGAASRPQK